MARSLAVKPVASVAVFRISIRDPESLGVAAPWFA